MIKNTAHYLIIALFSLFTFSCGTEMSPSERGIELQDCTNKSDCDPFEDHIIGVFNQDKALFTAQFTVEDHYDEDFGNLWADATIYWTDTICPKNGQYKLIYKKECYFGRMWSCDEIYVSLSNKDSTQTCGSALLHEFGHCLHMSMGKGGNAAHDDDVFWSLISEADLISCNSSWITREKIREKVIEMQSQHSTIGRETI